MLSSSGEDYLAAIYRAQDQGERGTTTAIAQKLGVSPASTTAMFQKLAQEGLVEYTEYMGVSLTKAGRRAAMDVIRRHRLAERFLTDILEIPWDQVHEMAHRMEHALPPEVIDRFAGILDNPSVCPHGYPIPTNDGHVSNVDVVPLNQLQVPARVRIERVDEEDADLLRYLHENSLTPGTMAEITEKSKFDDVMKVRVDERELMVGQRVSKAVFVTPVHEQPHAADNGS